MKYSMFITQLSIARIHVTTRDWELTLCWNLHCLYNLRQCGPCDVLAGPHVMFLLLSVKKRQATVAVLLERNLSSELLAGCKKDCTVCCKKDCTVLVYNIFDTIVQQDTGHRWWKWARKQLCSYSWSYDGRSNWWRPLAFLNPVWTSAASSHKWHFLPKLSQAYKQWVLV